LAIGKCTTIEGGSALPKRRCYCQDGFFGPDCRSESPLTSSNYSSSSYTFISTRGNVNFGYRIVKDEVEGVIIGKGTTSWVAVGERENSCLNDPN